MVFLYLQVGTYGKAKEKNENMVEKHNCDFIRSNTAFMDRKLGGELLVL